MRTSCAETGQIYDQPAGRIARKYLHVSIIGLLVTTGVSEGVTGGTKCGTSNGSNSLHRETNGLGAARLSQGVNREWGSRVGGRPACTRPVTPFHGFTP